MDDSYVYLVHADRPNHLYKDKIWKNGKYYYIYDKKTGKIYMDSDAKKRLAQLKIEAEKAEKEAQKYNTNNLHGKHKGNDYQLVLVNKRGKTYYKTKSGKKVEDPAAYRRELQKEEYAAKEKAVRLSTQYKRNLRLAEEEYEQLKQQRKDDRKEDRKNNNVFNKIDKALGREELKEYKSVKNTGHQGAAYDRAKTAYDQTFYGKVGKGANAIAKVFSKLKRKKRKAVVE